MTIKTYVQPTVKQIKDNNATYRESNKAGASALQLNIEAAVYMAASIGKRDYAELVYAGASSFHKKHVKAYLLAHCKNLRASDVKTDADADVKTFQVKKGTKITDDKAERHANGLAAIDGLENWHTWQKAEKNKDSAKAKPYGVIKVFEAMLEKAKDSTLDDSNQKFFAALLSYAELARQGVTLQDYANSLNETETVKAEAEAEAEAVTEAEVSANVQTVPTKRKRTATPIKEVNKQKEAIAA